MSVLAWLFGLGALAIAFPFLFHLIRRTPKGQTEFSSLMFLKPTPPTLTRRSRLENILLLLMRVAAICLIAFAFMRPFFRGADTLSEFEVANRRVAILLDTSASMQRTGLWDQAKQKVSDVLDDLESGDDVALFAFDRTVTNVVEFEHGMDDGATDRAGLIRDSLNSLEPGWQRSDLGKAMVTVADRLDVWRDSEQSKNSSAPAKLQIVVVSDLQKGSKIDSLQSYQWPANVFVKFNSVVPVDYSNATVQLLESAAEHDDPSLRVRVANSDDSKLDQFFVNWSGSDQRENSHAVSFYVPAGTSHVLKVEPDQAITAQQFMVTGDNEDFDNVFYVVPTEQQVLDIAYLGDDDPDDPEHPQYYLRRALIETPSRRVNVRQLKTNEKIMDASLPILLVLTSPVSEAQRGDIDAYLNSGGSLLIAFGDDEMVENTSDWTSARMRSSESESANRNSRETYQMLAEIDFSSELFQPFANPRYNDFTRIRFWRHCAVELIEEAAVLARFENDDPAVWVRELDGGGRVFVFASGWQPTNSQLALSTKFVPLINGLVQVVADLPDQSDSLLVGDRIKLPNAEPSVVRTMQKPFGSPLTIEPNQTEFDDVDVPGIYRLDITGSAISNQTKTDPAAQESDPPKTNSNDKIQRPERQRVSMKFAVNVDRAESETAAIPIEQIEMFNVKVGEQETAATELAQMREMRDRDIENQQKVWKWLIVAALLLLIGETLLAGKTEGRLLAGESVSATASSRFSGETT